MIFNTDISLVDVLYRYGVPHSESDIQAIAIASQLSKQRAEDVDQVAQIIQQIYAKWLGNEMAENIPMFGCEEIWSLYQSW